MGRLFRNIFCLLAASLLWASCEQPYAFDVEEGDREMVVHAIFSPSAPFAADLTYSRSIFDKSDFAKIDDANVQVIDIASGTVIDLSYHEAGFYVSDSIFPQAGHQYELVASTESGRKLSALSCVPKDVEVVINAVEPMEEDGTTVLRIDFDIVNQEGSENYYVWDIVAPDNGDTPDDINDQFSSWLSGGNVNTNRNRYRPHWKVLYEDRDLSSDVIRTTIIATDSVAVANAQGSGSGTSDGGVLLDTSSTKVVVEPIRLRVQAVSKQLYDFYESLESHNRNGGLNTSYATPAELYTNIEGGYGVFAGYNENLLTID